MLGPAITPQEGLQLLACLDRSACVVQKHASLRAGDDSPLRKAGIPDDEAKFPSQPYIGGVTSRAKTATAEARQW